MDDPEQKTTPYSRRMTDEEGDAWLALTNGIINMANEEHDAGLRRDVISSALLAAAAAYSIFTMTDGNDVVMTKEMAAQVHRQLNDHLVTLAAGGGLTLKPADVN